MNVYGLWIQRVQALALGLVFSGVALANADLEKLIADPKNWAMQAGDMYNQRYSKLKQINASNVGKMQVAWTFSTGVLRGHEGSPLVIDDMMYLHTPFPNKVFAIDLDTQKIKWKYEPKQDPAVIPQMCCDTVNRGLAYAEGKIFLQQADSTLVALDAKTGKVVWTVKNGDPKVGAVNTNAPHVFKDKVITGISGGEWGVRGFLAAYDINTGKQVWKALQHRTGHRDADRPGQDHDLDRRRRCKPVGKDSSLKTWKGDQWKIGGGTTWGWYSYDTALNLMYYGTGNPSTWNPAQRPGDNKWSMTIFARDVDTGMAKWVYQMTPYDEWDFDGINEMILADINVKGKPTKALVHFDRNGFGYTLDRTTGALLVAEKYDPTVNWATHVDMKTGRPQVVAKYSTAQERARRQHQGHLPGGARHQGPAAGGVRPEDQAVLRADQPRLHGLRAVQGRVHRRPAVRRRHAVDVPGAGQPRRHGQLHRLGRGHRQDRPVQAREVLGLERRRSTPPATSSFYGTLEGYLKCVDAKDINKELCKFKTPSGIIGNVFTYEHKGKQYIGVFSGIGGWAGIGMAAGLEKDTDGLGAVGGYKELREYTELGGSLTVFALPQ